MNFIVYLGRGSVDDNSDKVSEVIVMAVVTVADCTGGVQNSQLKQYAAHLLTYPQHG